MRLMVRIGTGCETLMNMVMRDVPCKRVRFDELWCYVGKKQRHMKPNDDSYPTGNTWTFVALDGDTKLIPSPGALDRETRLRVSCGCLGCWKRISSSWKVDLSMRGRWAGSWRIGVCIM